MASTAATLPPDNTLLNLYRGRVIDQIEEELLKDVKPKVRAAAEAAAKDLEFFINKNWESAALGQVVHLHIKMNQ